MMGVIVRMEDLLGICSLMVSGWWRMALGALGTYGEEEKWRKGLVSLNAWAVVRQAASAAIVEGRRIVVI